MMLYFDLKTAPIAIAVRWGKVPLFRFARLFKGLFFAVFLFVTVIFLAGFFIEVISREAAKNGAGIALIFLSFTLTFWLTERFFKKKLKKPRLLTTLKQVAEEPERYNLAAFLSFEAAKAASRAVKIAKGRGVSSTHLFYALLGDNPEVLFVFSRALLDSKKIKKMLKSSFADLTVSGVKKEGGYTESFENTLLGALQIAHKKGHSRITVGDIMASLARKDLLFKKILIDQKLKIVDIENLTWWIETIHDRIEKSKQFWEYGSLMQGGTVAKEWTAGYAITLDRFGHDITRMVKKRRPPMVGHGKEILQAERILSRQETNNVLIVGEPGTGRKNIVYTLAQKSIAGESLPGVNYKRIVELDIRSLLAQISTAEEVEVLLDTIFSEVVAAGNIILVIDEFHNYVGKATGLGIVDISGIIGAYLNIPQFQLIAITTYDGLHRNIEKNPSILALLGKVEVSEISLRETLLLLEDFALVLEQKHKIFISYPAIREVVTLTDSYLASLSFPRKALDVLDEVAVYVSSTVQDRVMLPKHVAEIMTEKTEIPIGEIEAKEKETLLNLENLIHQRIINQKEAVKEVSTALRRARSAITVRKGPMGTFLFLGPTGVGKTETAKALAQFYFRSEKRMIRLDMSEFQDTKDIARLIGSPAEPGLLTTPVRENPFSLILLDEIEKAHPNILNIFLQVLDEGHITDGRGRKVDFRNTIIIATSNAGYKVILDVLRRKVSWGDVKQKLLNYLFDKGTFRPEFINRFDAVVVFGPLSKENLFDIAELMLQKLKKNMKEKGIEFVITDSLKAKIAELGYNPVFGARAMRRVIQDKVENVLAAALLSDKLKRGDRVEVKSGDFTLTIT